ncbi:MAG: sodium-dependent transporter [Chitinophagales bacterium]|nr:sodium-dependent transporter [Chitinophagales bacterium]HAE12865.1 sodium:calcium symporter [Bacteroidota bacterium]MCB9020799.1 sodium-dependent transporter [Chitinophagales bacterium]MCB9031283.1 sodium-dependent transporter [Chitinophagales bacterium]HPE97209.1 sodium-dependent transporter [Chitinophagales bacterium]
MSAKTESWGTRVGLILAMAGNAVGLGNFLRFPVQAVNNGGGAFIIPYIICFLVMGVPLLWIEWASGRYGGKFGHHSTPFILDKMDKRKFWKYVGVFGIFTNVAVAAYYCYIESWTISYVFHSLTGTFNGMTQGEVSGFYDKYLDVRSSTTGIPYEAVVFYVVCLILNTYILSRGLHGVEKAAKIGVPLLLVFGGFLGIRSLTMGSSMATAEFPDANSIAGLNFLWKPAFDSLANPTVWLNAAGQIFFTLSVGMGTIHCYAAYVKSKDDIALNAMSAGWMNEFVEVVLGSLIVIPLAAGFFGVDWLKENAGFGMAFRTMPYMFEQWGGVLSALAGMMWFGLLFFAGITSSLAMGTPWMGFMRDEFGYSRNKGAMSFGLIVLLMGLPTVLIYNFATNGTVNSFVFNEYDYWAGTVSLVVFALAETILFVWVFGLTKGWKEINDGGDIRVPDFYKPIIKWITPLLLLAVFIGSLITPEGNDWVNAFQNGWVLDNGSIIKTIANAGLKEQIATATDPAEISRLENQLLYTNAARVLLVLLFAGISLTVYRAYAKRIKEGRA